MSHPSGAVLPSRAYEHLAPLFVERDELPPDDPARDRLRRRLIVGHLPLARSVARRHTGRGSDLHDLEQVAAIGLIKAVDRFSVHRRTPFVAFAVPTIAGEISHHHRDRAGTIRVPRPVRERQPGVLTATAELEQQLGRDLRPVDVAERLDIDAGAVREVMRSLVVGSCLSLDLPTRDRTGAVEYYDAVLGRTDDRLDAVEDRCGLAPLVAALTEHQKRLLVLRFAHDLTQIEIGRRVGLSQMTVSRQLTSILETLRRALSA